jgi:hypothetical protein
MRRTAPVAKGSATVLCLAATLLIAACGSPTPQDFPALSLTNGADPDQSSEPGH